MFQIVGVVIKLHERHVSHVLHLVNVASVHLELKEVVKVVARKVVVVVGEHILLGYVWANVVHQYPEHRVFYWFAAKLIGAVKHRADCLHTRLHRIAARVKLPPLHNVVAKHLVGRNVGVFYCEFRVFVAAAFGCGVEYVETVKHFLHLDFVLVSKQLFTVKIFVCRNLVVGEQTHDDEKQVLAVGIWLIRVIKSRVLSLGQVE